MTAIDGGVVQSPTEPKPGFWIRAHEWATTVDHKKIGIMYITIALIFLLRGFIDASMVRAQQATAGSGGAGYLEPLCTSGCATPRERLLRGAIAWVGL